MATNKNKTSAALFELIDKSTLKIPKTAGALKIPSWWSSKTNPPVEAERSPGPSSTPAPAPALTPIPLTPTNGTVVSAAAANAPSSNGTNGAAGTPVFNGAAPSSSAAPSIRPPVKIARVEVTPPTGANAPNTSAVGRGVGAGLSGRRVFPQTVDPRTVNQGAGSPRIGGRGVPMWVMVAAGAVVLSLIVLVVTMSGGPKPGKAGAGGTGLGVTIPPPAGQPRPTIIYGGHPVTAGNPPPVTPHPAPHVEVAPVDAPHAGRVVPAADVRRVPGNYYVVMVSAKSEKVASENASFIAAHGVDVWIKVQPTGFFSVVSVDSFSKRTDPRADALATKIVEISHQHPEFLKRQRGPYDGAFFTKVP